MRAIILPTIGIWLVFHYMCGSIFGDVECDPVSMEEKAVKGDGLLINRLKILFFNRLHFLKSSDRPLAPNVIEQFETIYEQYIVKDSGLWIDYDLDYPKHLFLQYLIKVKDVLVHGSNNPDIEIFEPRNQTLANNKPVKAVFAASDAIWSLYFAVINRSEYQGTLKNLCFSIPTKKEVKRYYYFSVNQDFQGEYWRNGTMYILPKSAFAQGGSREEWICQDKVKPLAKISVTPEEFPFLDQVRKHDENMAHVKVVLTALFWNK
ncbi:hypothetical protein GI584_17455 [Gracilibacillus salitolerans]|uniref:Uncharacterized protein n=1 Tax=Gracilibacillus salitolerans TaxID=2663022 RepID=A0A5Q2TL57_9BACI|nr:hypothetical protein GI584_17455 [Gracilibacillus salitolerans]